jgi:hypothetical protein
MAMTLDQANQFHLLCVHVAHWVSRGGWNSDPNAIEAYSKSMYKLLEEMGVDWNGQANTEAPPVVAVKLPRPGQKKIVQPTPPLAAKAPVFKFTPAKLPVLSPSSCRPLAPFPNKKPIPVADSRFSPDDLNGTLLLSKVHSGELKLDVLHRPQLKQLGLVLGCLDAEVEGKPIKELRDLIRPRLEAPLAEKAATPALPTRMSSFRLPRRLS